MKMRSRLQVAFTIAIATSSVAMASLNTGNQDLPETTNTDGKIGPSFTMANGLHLVLNDFSVTDKAGNQITFTAGENIALTAAADGTTTLSYIPFEVEDPSGQVAQVRVSRDQLPNGSLTFFSNGDESDLVASADRARTQEARARQSRVDGTSYPSYNSSPFDGLFGGGQSANYGATQEQSAPAHRYGRRGGRMVLKDAQGHFQAQGCLAFVQSRVGWPGGPVGNGVNMVLALIRRLRWSLSDCSPAEGKVASWSGGHYGAGHTAIYNSARGCWEYDDGCTGLQISGFRLRHCAQR